MNWRGRYYYKQELLISIKVLHSFYKIHVVETVAFSNAITEHNKSTIIYKIQMIR